MPIKLSRRCANCTFYAPPVPEYGCQQLRDARPDNVCREFTPNTSINKLLVRLWVVRRERIARLQRFVKIVVDRQQELDGVRRNSVRLYDSSTANKD